MSLHVIIPPFVCALQSTARRRDPLFCGVCVCVRLLRMSDERKMTCEDDYRAVTLGVRALLFRRPGVKLCLCVCVFHPGVCCRASVAFNINAGYCSELLS